MKRNALLGDDQEVCTFRSALLQISSASASAPRWHSSALAGRAYEKIVNG